MSQCQRCANFDLGTGDWHFSLPFDLILFSLNFSGFLHNTYIIYLDYYKLFKNFFFSPAGHIWTYLDVISDNYFQEMATDKIFYERKKKIESYPNCKLFDQSQEGSKFHVLNLD